ncbi:biotin--[acetyl-CoA-carboxylase] ligase [Bacteroides caecigallinarum]|uniref:biotin--[acetyl-CoA-carboxylase] ligase n=1 Tax=Bacteroides caecigallinarum TaxID=1411144 RepID=UPI001F193461|nr:biotin--[acetyl-CoA-carboxylase] ligase [Bacteroides caecigallinarum]MCF2582538.1 biotin--[acetyl-CoA-carboxylase] ligase [Bacteroides caecigallinarum]
MSYPEPIYIPQTISTNVSLAEICSKGYTENLTSVYSSFQTDGRGQRGNKWESEDGKNLLFSFVIFPKGLPAREHFILLQITALALFDTLSEYTDGISIKWPNDIYWMDRKICGTLIENDLSGMNIERSISGTGVNLNQKIFRSDAPNPISLSQITGQEYDIETVLHKIMNSASIYHRMFDNGESDIIRKKYFEAIYRKDGFYMYKDDNGTFDAIIEDIDKDGRLVLKDREGRVRKYLFKEVSYII